MFVAFHLFFFHSTWSHQSIIPLFIYNWFIFYFIFCLAEWKKKWNQEHKSIMQMYACVLVCTLLTHIRKRLGYEALFSEGTLMRKPMDFYCRYCSYEERNVALYCSIHRLSKRVQCQSFSLDWLFFSDLVWLWFCIILKVLYDKITQEYHIRNAHALLKRRASCSSTNFSSVRRFHDCFSRPEWTKHAFKQKNIIILF